jgi:predicted PurR-regulated permease PerM
MAERRLVLVIIVGGIGLLGALYALDVMSDLIGIVITALFFSFALEPAVSYLNTKRGWRRGTATGAVFVVMIAAGAFILALATPAIVTGFQQLIDNAPDWVAKIADWLRPFGVDVSQERLTEEIQKNAETVVTNAAGGVFAITSSILGGIFRWSATGLFLFYIVAEGPTLRRVVCSVLPPERQRDVLFIWEQAIDQTGGYFYSRLVLAVINGTGMLIVLSIFGVPFAVPLAIFVGVVSAFVPIIGTYIGGAVPVLFAFLTSTGAGIAALIYIVLYQQIENFFLSPRLTARTMSLHPAVAFAAALIGGALGGLLFAFLALPAAGVLQAALKARARRYQVVEAELTNAPEEPLARQRLFERSRDAAPREGADRTE